MPGQRRLGLSSMILAVVVGTTAVFTAPPAGAAGREGQKIRHLTLTFVDRGRPTQLPTGEQRSAARRLVTEVYAPRGKGPFPLILFAHGFDGHPLKLTELLSSWARAGYVVAAPAFPLTNDRSGEPTHLVDYANQPGDLSFVAGRMIKEARRRRSPLSGRMDARHVGLAGHSLGGVTALGTAFNTCCRDRRIDAVVVMDAREAPFRGGRFVYRRIPLLIVHLTGDPVIAYSNAEALFADAAKPKYLMALSQGVHFEPFEDVPNPHDGAVIAATTAFWDAYLGRDRAARRRIVRAGTEAGLSTVTARTR